jgi:hypothetical protein
MPANTVPLGFPYPLGTDQPAGHTQIEALAQALNDYLNAKPSNAWAMVITAGGTTCTYTGYATWVRHGRKVFLEGTATLTSGATGVVQISNLPFSIAANSTPGGEVVYFATVGGQYSPFAAVASGQNLRIVRLNDTSGHARTLSVSDTFRVNVAYETDAPL